MENSIYYEEQRLSRFWFWVSICVIDLLLLFVLFNLFDSESNIILSLFFAVALLVLAGLDIYIFLFIKLTVKIDFEFLYINLFPFAFEKIPVDEIFLTEITQFNRFRDYGGIGIGRSFKNNEIAYFLSGNTGVRIYYPLLKKLMVGAASPKKLVNAIVYAQQRKKILSEID